MCYLFIYLFIYKLKDIYKLNYKFFILPREVEGNGKLGSFIKVSLKWKEDGKENDESTIGVGNKDNKGKGAGDANITAENRDMDDFGGAETDIESRPLLLYWNYLLLYNKYRIKCTGIILGKSYQPN